MHCQRAGYALKSLLKFSRFLVNTIRGGLMKYYRGDPMHEHIGSHGACRLLSGAAVTSAKVRLGSLS